MQLQTLTNDKCQDSSGKAKKESPQIFYIVWLTYSLVALHIESRVRNESKVKLKMCNISCMVGY